MYEKLRVYNFKIPRRCHLILNEKSVTHLMPHKEQVDALLKLYLDDISDPTSHFELQVLLQLKLKQKINKIKIKNYNNNLNFKSTVFFFFHW